MFFGLPCSFDHVRPGYPMIHGGCYCGDVRYEADGIPFHLTNCHCTICRRTTGAPFVAWLTVPRSTFCFVQGAPASFRSSEQATRRFCRRCGTQLTFEHDDAPDEIDVTTSSLDEPNAFAPEDHTFVSGKLAWVQLADGLPQFPGKRGAS